MRLKESVKNIIAVILFYSLIVGGVILINNRFGEIQNQSNVSENC